MVSMRNLAKLLVVLSIPLLLGGCGATQEVPTQSAACRAAKIALYPTWEFKDGSRLEGWQNFSVLAQKIGFEHSGDTFSPTEIDKLANALTQAGAKIYGSKYCSACNHQKEMFGSAAWPKINYVECSV